MYLDKFSKAASAIIASRLGTVYNFENIYHMVIGRNPRRAYGGTG